MKILNSILLFIGLAVLSNGYTQNIYNAIDGEVSFFSETPLENIEALNKTLKALINTDNGEIAFVVTNVGFKFDKPLMEEHFNENYIESDKYKVSTFKGKLSGDLLDFSKDGTYKVKAKGTLDLHGVEKEREIEGNIEIKDGKIYLKGEFEISLKEHKIKIPKIVTEKIAENVLVRVNITLAPKSK